ncbi:MAG TPA: hypothetical protein VK065_07510 [Brevibacterium sp.]|nr:hypothetical protein [Brevibacterium sp.]
MSESDMDAARDVARQDRAELDPDNQDPARDPAQDPDTRDPGQDPTAPTVDEENPADPIDDPTLQEPSEAQIRDTAVDDLPPVGEELAERDAKRQLGDVEPGADGPVGTGVEGADDVLVDADDDAGRIGDASGSPSGRAEDDAPAADQGNREGDEMVDEGDDASLASDMAGDDLGGNLEVDPDDVEDEV